MNKYMKLANENAKNGVKRNEGGPFGAVIVDKNGKIVSEGNNRVLIDKDPTAHAEVVAIRNACKNLEKYDLSGMTIYSSCEPCPMCLSAIIWSNIKDVKYACTREDAAKIGFRDDAIYNYLEGKNKNLLNIEQIDRDECKDIFDRYLEDDRKIY